MEKTMLNTQTQDYFTSLWGGKFFQDAWEYSVDAMQRSILFTDIMRKRGNLYLEHKDAGQPPVLVFDYETIIDARKDERPVNYALVKILDPNHEQQDSSARQLVDPTLRPIVVIDPRAGHGPGIGGSKLDSQIGMALKAGHPVYFVMFFTNPEPGQTMRDVQQAEIRFLEEIKKRHPDAQSPAIIGNCQAGWATALIGADRPDVTGPMVFNGSPLSYWGGVDGANPMRYKGGLLGGTWMTSFFSDLGNGRFDGANLVANFEDLNPANTLWTKQYNVWANVDTEEERYLNFEKWWGGFFKMNREEIHFIVESLFVGNELESGRLKLGKEHWVSLKNFKDPIVVFASQGDNITPPQQALNWIYKVYKTVDEIKRNGQVIVYIVHPKIGHLGIFVGSKIAKKEHNAIIGTVDMINYLAPGLYEMVITDDSLGGQKGHNVEFIPKEMEDILALDDGLDDEAAFNSVAAISRFNDKIYQTFVSPWVQAMVTEDLAESIRQVHPLRLQRSLFSDKNPLMQPYEGWAKWVKENRMPVAEDNIFLDMEKKMSEGIEDALNDFRDRRDAQIEKTFKMLYENIWMQTLFEEEQTPDNLVVERETDNEKRRRAELWQKAMEEGGFEEAIIRLVLAMASADGSIDQREYIAARLIFEDNDQLKKLKPGELREKVKEQAALVEYDRDAAIKAVAGLLPTKAQRQKVFAAALEIANADFQIDAKEQELLDQIKTVLKL